MPVHFGIGDGNNPFFNGIESSENTLNIYDDQNYTCYDLPYTCYTDAHPQMNGIMYWDKHP